MAMLGISATHKTTILPEGGRDFLRRRMMELVGVGVAIAGVLLLMSIFTFSNADPSLNHATGTPPNNLMGLPGAYVSDLLLQTFGLAIVLVPVALITWGVRMVRTHHLGFFGLRLSLLLLALLMMSVACVGLGDVGGAVANGLEGRGDIGGRLVEDGLHRLGHAGGRGPGVVEHLGERARGRLVDRLDALGHLGGGIASLLEGLERLHRSLVEGAVQDARHVAGSDAGNCQERDGAAPAHGRFAAS